MQILHLDSGQESTTEERKALQLRQRSIYCKTKQGFMVYNKKIHYTLVYMSESYTYIVQPRGIKLNHT